MSASIGQTFFAPDADRRSLARILKISGALGVIGIGTYAVMSEQGYIATDNAVISAYVVSIRTPIDGYVSGATRRIGSEIHRGDVIATVNNPRIDDQRLADLRAHLRRVQANQISTAIEREAFSRKRGELLARSDDHRRLMTERMAGMANSIERSSDAKVAAREEAHRDLQRKLALVRSGFVSRADVDRAQSAYDVAAKEVDSLHAQFMAARSGTASAKHGVLTDPGANDVSYSMQRADEIDIHITEVDHTLANLAAEQSETEARVATEEARLQLLGSAWLASPASGMLWKLGASDGEHVAAGAMTAEVVDCNAAFIIASVPQAQLAKVQLGADARFRLSGETVDRVGRVLSIAGGSSFDRDRIVASTPLGPNNAAAIVSVSIAPSSNVAGSCLVGRTARVLLAATGGGGAMENIFSFINRVF